MRRRYPEAAAVCVAMLAAIAPDSGCLVIDSFSNLDAGNAGGGGAGPTTTTTTNTGASGGGGASGGASGGGFVSAGAAGGAGGAETGGEGGNAPDPTVPCGDGTGALEECAPGQVCCFDTMSSTMDHCDGTGDCGTNEYTLACNEPADCRGGICCALFDEVLRTFDGVVTCQSNCTGADRIVCADAADCKSGDCSQLFSDSVAPEYASAYKICAQ